jgi:hypothetical protein
MNKPAFVEHTFDGKDHNAAFCPRCGGLLYPEMEYIGSYMMACPGYACAYRAIHRAPWATGVDTATKQPVPSEHKWEAPKDAVDWVPPVRQA